MSVTKQPYIVVADDDPDDLDFFMTSFCLRCPGVQVEAFTDGDTAMEFLAGKNADELPRLLLLDYKMPRVSGIDVLRTLSESQHFNHLPILIWTNSQRTNESEECKRWGAVGYFVKPNSENELEPILSRIIDVLENSDLGESEE